MRDIKPVSWEFRGDRRKAVSLIPYARKVLGEAMSMMGGKGGQTLTKFLPNMASVRVLIVNNVPGMPPLRKIRVDYPWQQKVIERPEIKKFPVLVFESGYLNIEDLTTTDPDDWREFPVLWQSARTLGLYNLAGVPVENPNYYPVSCYYDETEYTRAQSAALAEILRNKLLDRPNDQLATGKFKLYRQARAGVELQDPAISIVPVTNIVSDSTGLWRDDEWNYWIVQITPQKLIPDVKFTKLSFMSGYDVRTKLKIAVARGLAQEELMLETYLLAHAEITTEEHTAYILNDQGATWEYPSLREWLEWRATNDPYSNFSLSQPIAHGWKFNWDGDRPACVILHNVTSNTYYNNFFLHNADFRSIVTRINLNNHRDDNGVLIFTADVEYLETNDWHFSHRWGYWIWLSDSYSSFPFSCPLHLSVQPTAFNAPTNTPIYGYYTGTTYKNNTFELVRITVKVDYNDISYSGECPGRAGAHLFQMGSYQGVTSNWTASGDSGWEKISFSFLDLTSNKQPNQGKRYATQVPTGSWGEWVEHNISYHNPETEVFVQCFETLACGEASTYSISLGSGLYASKVWSSGFFISGDAWEQVDVNEYRDTLRVVIPLNNSEAVIFAKVKEVQHSRELGGAYYNNVQVGTRLEQWSIIYDTPDGPVQGPTGTGFNVLGYGINGLPSGLYPTTKTYMLSSADALYVFNKMPGSYLSYSFSKMIEINEVPGLTLDTRVDSPLHYTSNFNSIESNRWLITFKVISGVDREFHFAMDCNEEYGSAKVEWNKIRLCHAGYPKNLALDDKTSPIGFA